MICIEIEENLVIYESHGQVALAETSTLLTRYPSLGRLIVISSKIPSPAPGTLGSDGSRSVKDVGNRESLLSGFEAGNLTAQVAIGGAV